MERANKKFSNERVSASAGSGKTFSLTTRFIALAFAAMANARQESLLARVKNAAAEMLGAAPRQSKDARKIEKPAPDPFSIIALTFTKKAAGEFLAKILTRLADASQSDAAAKELAADLAGKVPGLGGANRPSRADFEALLALCAKNINLLHLGTIDSFFAKIIKQNAGTLKIFAPVKIMDEAGAEAQKFMLETVSKMMNKRAVSDAETENFAELVKRAAFGKDQKQFRDVIVKTVGAAHDAYLAVPNLAFWGNWHLSGAAKCPAAFDADAYASLLSDFEDQAFDFKELQAPLKFFSDSTPMKLGKTDSPVMAQFLSAYRAGELENLKAIEYKGKPFILPEGAAKTAKEMLDMLYAEHFGRLCQATKAAGKIAAIYESEYDASIRAKGKITFGDLPYVLADQDRAADMEQIEYKLGSKFNHWLFDEFQDTSEIQWRVLKNIVEDAIYDENKSFYYVGDIKQSLYAWRGATPALFNEIFEFYNKNAPLINKSKPLTVSWRSGENVIRAINAVFGDAAALARVFPRESAELFSAEFQPHKSAESREIGGKPRLPSYAQLSLYAGSRSDDDDTAAACETILSIIKKTDPLKRGITCAVLVNKNSQANAVVDFLKSNGFNAAGELSVSMRDDRPIVALFTAILRGLAHPQNTASEAFAEMADIGEFTRGFSGDFVAQAKLEIYARGFKKFADRYCAFVGEKFGVKNAAELKWIADACVKLDRDGAASLDDAADYISDAKIGTSATSGVIQVMTIHKSKGLSFGMVVMLAKNETKTRRTIMRIGNSVMISPIAAVAEMDAVLFEADRRRRISENFEAICKMYVAATRPERALYIVAPQIAEKSFNVLSEKETHFTQLLLGAFSPELAACKDNKTARRTYAQILELGATLKMGDEHWLEALRPAKKARDIDNILTLKGAGEVETANKALSPSLQNKPQEGEESGGDAELGTRVHNFFEKITTLKTPPDASRFCGDTALLRGVENLLADPRYRAFFDVPDAEAFNEFPFAAYLGGELVEGRIDRLVLLRGEDGGFKAAKILDYKPRADQEKYAPQMSLYKSAVARIFGIPPANIETYIAQYMA